MKLTRLKEIENYVQQHESVSLDVLCTLFKVSKNTIRRDISVLEEKGVIKKIYGGITVSQPKQTVPFTQRQISHQAEKQIIARLAGQKVQDNDRIFIDSGTTTMHMIPFLADKHNVTIVTNNLNVLQSALDYPNLNIYATGGLLFRQTNSLIGTEAIQGLNHYNISKAFMATTGVSIEHGVTNSSSLEYQIKKDVIQKNVDVHLLADHSKLGVVSLMTYCDLAEITTFITDRELPPAYQDFFRKHGIEWLAP